MNWFPNPLFTTASKAILDLDEDERDRVLRVTLSAGVACGKARERTDQK